MRLLIQTLAICLALSLSLAAPSHHEHHVADEPDHDSDDHPDRCEHNEYDAVIENAEGIPYFFKGDHVFTGFEGEAKLTKDLLPELDKTLVGHIDAAFRMPPEDSPDHHEHLYFFLVDKVYNYENHKLVEGFPKSISEVFPGIPDNLDASVECHKPDCPSNSIIFFKEHEIFHFDISTKKVDQREFKSMPNCSAAFRYMGHYYCLHGHQFSKFNPNTGAVHGHYPKEIRDYFMKCKEFGDKTEEQIIDREQCSHVHLDAITEEDDGDFTAFRGHYYLGKVDGKFHAGTIESAFKGLEHDVDAAFTHGDHFHIIKDDQVYAYKVAHADGNTHEPLNDYPKSVKDDLGIEGHVDAAFICPNDHETVHIIKEHTMYDVDMTTEPHHVKTERPISAFKKIDTAMCGSKGVTVIVGDHFYHFDSPLLLAAAKVLPEKHDVTHDLLGCHSDEHHILDRCKHNEFDAVIENAAGVPYFFKGDHLFKGFEGEDEPTNETFPELDYHLVGHIDAAFRMPPEDSPDHHEHLYFFLDDKVYNYENHKLVDGFPKSISEVFPGVPDHLDAAVECHKPDCPSNSIIFFKEHEIFHFDIHTKKVDDEREFKTMPNCTAAFRYMDHYYCLHGHQFSKFNPNTGAVHGHYPKEIRDYFMKCKDFGDKTEEQTIDREQCSHVHLDAITEEDDGDLFAFRGYYYLSKVGGKFHAGTIESAFHGLHHDVDAVFSHGDHFHIIKDDHVYAYTVSHEPGQPHTAIQGYPKSLKEELGIEGHVDAAFICASDHDIVHVIKDHTIYDVNLKENPRTVKQERPVAFHKEIDAAMCGSKGVTVIIGDYFYHFDNADELATSKVLPDKHDLNNDLLGCHTDDEHHVLDRCKHNEFDAVIENAAGVPYFFKGDHLFKGFEGEDEPTNETFPELDYHLVGHIDAAFRMPPEDSPDHHEHLYFFLDDKVYNYENHKLVDGFPKSISEVFPGIPDHLDASVECHKPDCPSNSIIFFKEHEIFHFDISTKKVDDEREFKSMPNCTGAFRYMDHYYCLHGHQFSKFNPNTGEVHGHYPKEIRDYFMKCKDFGDKTEEQIIDREQCSHVHLDAITEEDDGDFTAFRGYYYLSKVGGKFHAGTIESAFKALHHDVDAAFTHGDHFHIIKDDHVFAYNVAHADGNTHEPLKNYPKTVKEDLGIEGHVDAAFVCPNDKETVYVISDHTLYDVDLKDEPHHVKRERPIGHFKEIDAAMCGSKGVTIIVGDYFYHYDSPMLMATSKMIPQKHDVNNELLGCHTDDE